jgi:hypothetical protein
MTVQTKDSIIVKGIKYDLYTYPLDSYWSKKNPKPGIRMPRTSCWRGYIATWEIIDEYLYLTDIQYFAPGEDQGIDYVFPNNSGKVKATWFTGELKIPIGDELTSQVMWDTVYETDWFIEINEGKVVSQRYKANY